MAPIAAVAFQLVDQRQLMLTMFIEELQHVRRFFRRNSVRNVDFELNPD
jgi:hypothetical protein